MSGLVGGPVGAAVGAGVGAAAGLARKKSAVVRQLNVGSPVSSLTLSSTTSEDPEHHDTSLTLHSTKLAARNRIRSRFHSSSDLIHRLFVCISGVADQLQTNYASDLRSILKTLFEVMATKSPVLRSAVLEDCALCQESISSSELAAKTRDGQFEDPPDWVPDEACNSCIACKAPFTVIRRKHHCRSCGKIFCSRCSSHSAPLPRYGQVKPSNFKSLSVGRHVRDCARGPPRVSHKVTHRQSVRLGSAIKLPCPVEGDPPPLIMWTKDGRNIHSGWVRFRFLRMGLKIKEVEADDAGTYICKATNGFGSVNINYTLIVIDESDRTSPETADGTQPEEGTDEKLVRPRFTEPSKMRKRVIARPVGSSVRSNWLKDDLPLSEHEVGEGRQKKWTLSLRNLSPEHSGRYTCCVTNRAGQINATYKLEVIERTNSKPVLTGTHPINTTVDYGGTTSLQCKVRSDVKPVIQWLKRVESNEESRFNSTIEVGEHRFMVLPTGEVWSRPDGSYLNKLLISRAKEEDAGMYICLGANTMGYSFRSAFLTVLPDTKVPITTVFSAAPTSLPWPVVIGIPAGIVFIFGTVLLWFCQSRKHCPPPTSAHTATVQGHTQRPLYRERDRLCMAASSSGPDKDCITSRNFEEYLPQQQLLLSQTALPPKLYPKIYTDIHTHTHSHVEGKVHQHQHIHFQC
ncbi:hypothetical protein WMY93_016995 [Mugilogobius chulae]|uniref:Fibroblast growth factor receptor-like 1 n=1 Tax=Mugilogobius chulae TaxID=88201 RepID=A0AAW0NN71_9GOBI